MGSSELTDDEIEALLQGEDISDSEGKKPVAKGDLGSPTKKQVQKVSFGDIEEEGPKGVSGEGSNLSLLMDVSLDVSVEIGRTKKSVQEVLALNIGSVIELNKLSGEPVDLLVNGKVIAKAEVVIIDENFGIRITEIVKPRNRVTFD